MQVYDIVILILVGWLTLRGAMKGMVSQLASIAAVITSFWAAVRFGPVLEPVVQSAFNVQAPWNKVLGITLAFVGASIAVMLLHRVLANLISVIRMQKYDRLCGALFGFLKGVLIGMILTFFAVMLSEQTRELATQSRSGAILVRLIQRTQTLLPDDVSVLIESNLEGFMKQLGPGKDTSDGAIAQVKAASGVKNTFEVIQNTVTNLVRFSGSSDPADDQPNIPNEVVTSTSTFLRDYPSPAILMSHFTPTSDTGVSPAGTTSNVTLAETTPITQSGMGANATPSQSTELALLSGNAVNPAAISVISPSAGMLPMTSTATPASSALPNGETDWRTLLREMR